ncbi:hypothetical protein [Leptolyngbya sp. GGD]|uniref:hypothetical protein n=1 Tax=Leptolyngbya sp. GGD TaxID=2997907 RepID=UPI00227A3712|nr:hypothetical protein [Leptolyngbya sp. GGD]MCY6494221.1 hypothetical protein [Leptolyngbya sp. GGD]
MQSKHLLASTLLAGLMLSLGTTAGFANEIKPIHVNPNLFGNLTALNSPNPVLAFKGTENKNGYTYYNLTVTNWQQINAALFTSAPDLPACGANTNSSRTWVDIYDAQSNQRIYGFCAFSNPENLTKLWFAVQQGKTPPQSVYIVLHDRKTDRKYRSNAVSLGQTALNEDCIAFNPNNTAVENVQGRWTIVENGNHLMFNFEGDRARAEQSLRTIKRYGMNKSCFVGRPQPSFQYMLVNNAAPVGAMRGEDCIPFNPATTTVSKINNRWKIVDGNHWMFDFEGNQAEAEQSLAVIRKYGFNQSCFVGRPNAKFTYLRR